MTSSEKPIFRDLNAEDEDPEVTEIDSLCMNCHDNGSTRIMLTRIPFFRDVVVMSFSCPHCGHSDNELRDACAARDKGMIHRLAVRTSGDLNRRVVRSEHAKVTIPEVELEIPALSQKGEVTTVEGIVDRVVAGLKQDQEKRRADHPQDAEKIDDFILTLARLKDVEANGPFNLILEDISGNSHMENPVAPKNDPQCKVTYFDRTREQNHELGIFSHSEVEDSATDDGQGDSTGSLLVPNQPGQHTLQELEAGEVMSFRTNCPDCNAPCDTNMKMTDIPHFKEVLIMATTCDQCGHRTNEVKSGGGIEEKGVRIEVKVRTRDDFSRDLLKSDTCDLLVPELELESGSHSLCGRFTTVEGMLRAMQEQLASLAGDSTSSEDTRRMDSFVQRMSDIIEGNIPVTLVLDDPAGNSYVQTLNDDGTLDEGLKITKYERSYEQNEELGLNDMKTEGYSQTDNCKV